MTTRILKSELDALKVELKQVSKIAMATKNQRLLDEVAFTRDRINFAEIRLEGLLREESR